MAPTIFRRDDQAPVVQPSEEPSQANYSPVTTNLITALVILMLGSLFITGGLFMVRARRRRMAQLRMQEKLNGPPMSPNYYSHQDPNAQRNMGLCAPAKPSHHRRTKSLTTPPDSPVFVVGETESLMDEKRWEAEHESNAARRESVPQIHLTFPETVDEKTGRRESKVVVVTVTEKGNVGLAPFQNEQQQHAPPVYSERENMKSLDLDRIGGLKDSKN